MDVSFSRLQIIFLLILSLGISNHVLVIPHLLKDAGRDSWISILAAYLVLVGWSILLFLILKSLRTTSFNHWLISRMGIYVFWIISSAIALYLLVAGMMIIFDTTTNVSIYFLPNTPSIIVILSFILISYSTARSGLKTIVYMSTVLLPIVWLLGIFVSISTIGSKDYGMLHPLFTEGLKPTLRGGAVVFGGSIDLLVILFLQHKLTKPMNYLSIFVLLTLLVGLILGPTMGAISVFGPSQAAYMRFPAFEQWRLIMIGTHISHVDFLAVFQLMAGSIVRTSLLIYILSDIIGNQFPKYRQTIMICGTVIMSIPAIFKVSDIKMQDIIHNYFYKYSIWFGVALTVALFAATYFPQRKGSTT
ncbi:endospore germination permease [Paenibacillus endoradicis]|uniref:endospore germination permease n=1 Tax=Paenibacillus endoradicis TaxID=2972487 RepID=UPI002159B5B5|nr:endospore germination permease [Paenibacillus endoradicis]MCR8656577.1 endospore germination permease [Paenibacillus endoradicis]